MTGRSGNDVIVRVPLGTIVTERFSDDLMYALVSLVVVIVDDIEILLHLCPSGCSNRNILESRM